MQTAALTPATKKTITIVLLAVVFFTMFFGWTGLTGYYKDMIAYSGNVAGLAENILYDLDLDSYEYDAAASVSKITKAISDLKLSPKEAITLTGSVSKIAKVAAKAEKYYYGSSGEIGKVRAVLVIANIIEIIVFYATILSLLYSIAMMVLKKKANFVIPFVGVILTFIFFIGITVAVNYGMAEDSILALKFWSFFSVICMTVALVWGSAYNKQQAEGTVVTADYSEIIGTVKKGVSKVSEVGKSVLQQQWNCPSCGAKCNGASDFCPMCGAKKPAVKKCQSCGAIVPENAMFCAKCGTKYEAPQNISFCPLCGKKLINDEVCDCRNTATVAAANEHPAQDATENH
ncbi:MAG: zinc ribbon domain-containing protein [Clostridia bacterium]|nr:zinc ribbon domain-containing protein [Clostridia bacterium]